MRAKQYTTSSISSTSRRVREGLLIVGMSIGLFGLLALTTYHRADPGWSHVSSSSVVANAGGQFGAWFADIFLYLFGYFAYLFPLTLIYLSAAALPDNVTAYSDKHRFLSVRLLGFLLLLIGGTGLCQLHWGVHHTPLPFNTGGILGDVIGGMLYLSFSMRGSSLLLCALVLAGVTLLTGLSWLTVADKMGKLILLACAKGYNKLWSRWDGYQDRRVQTALSSSETSGTIESIIRKRSILSKRRITPQINLNTDEVEQPTQFLHLPGLEERPATLFHANQNYQMPSINLLDPAQRLRNKTMTGTKLETLAAEVEAKLADFDVEAKVETVNPGPVITRFELRLAPGVKASKISGLARDLARSLSVVSIRVVEVIPGKPLIGLEVPNDLREMVRLGEVLSSTLYHEALSPLSLVLGKDISGEPVVVDLARMPHLLVAGTTGSGKSVGLNAMLLSLLYKATPQEVRLILIDPKMLELSIYQDIPHLLTPVVTDMKQAANALRWCVAEMERRYQLMAAMGVRNLQGANQKIVAARRKKRGVIAELAQHPQFAEMAETLEPFPYIVVVIDEFADMMMIVGKKVEEFIARIAQKARAAGIHLLLATQRPSVDVITGLIKANIPTRIAFQVSSRIDSRTILDQQGAEQLLGHGDMLYLPPGTGVPIRVHGAFVADHEVHKVVDFLRQQGKPEYLEEVLTTANDDIAVDREVQDDEDLDPLYDDAVAVVTETRRASVSGVQRRLKIGYNRAARLIEQMEREGLVSAMESNGLREVLAPPPPPMD